MTKIHGNIKDLTSFSSALSGMKVLAITVTCVSVVSVVIIWLIYLSKIERVNQQLDEARTQKFVMDPLSGFMLRGSFKSLERKDREYIYNAVARRFVDYWYDFDGETFKNNLEQGMNYCSQEVANMKLSDYLNKDFNLGQQLRDEKTRWYTYVDSVDLNMENKIGMIWAKRKIQKPYEHKWYNLVAKFKVRDLDKITPDNEYAALIEKWVVLNDDELEDYKY